MNCTHGGEATNIAPGARCPWCLNIVAEPARLATSAGVGTGSALTLEVRPTIPAAHIAANPVSPIARAAAAAPEADPAASGAPIAASAPTVASVPSPLPAGQSASVPSAARRTGADAAPIKHARNTDPDTARDAALSVTDAHKRRLYDHILALIFEHGPMTDYQLANALTARLGERIIATSAGKRRGELRDMGLLFDTKFKGPTETGPKKGIRWGLTPAGEVEVAA